MPTLFSEALLTARQKAGFPTAYRFYHASGGRPVLAVTYRKYLTMERGGILPLPDKFRRLQAALAAAGAPPGTPFVAAWLKTMAGEGPYAALLAPLLEHSPAAQAGRTPETGVFRVSPAQFRVMTASDENFKCALACGGRGRDAGGLASFIGLKAASAEKSLKALARCGLLKRSVKGRYSSAAAGRRIEYPADEPSREKFALLARGLKRTGTTAWRRAGIIRADAAELRTFFPLLDANLEAARACAAGGDSGKTAMYIVEAKVIKLWDF